MAVGERSPDEFYELLAVHAGELIYAYESFTDIKAMEEEIAQLRQTLYELMLYHLDVKTGWVDTPEVCKAREVLGNVDKEKEAT